MHYTATLAQRNIVYSRSRGSRERILPSLLILLIILFSVLYMVQANSVATGGYKIQKYKNEAAGLQSINKNLELKLTEVRSFGFLEQRVESLNMIKIGKVEYLSPTSQVAAR